MGCIKLINELRVLHFLKKKEGKDPESIRNSYTMGCPPVRGDNPRALASGLSYVQLDKHGITIYTTYISVDYAHHEIFRAKVGTGGIKSSTTPDKEAPPWNGQLENYGGGGGGA